MGLVSRRLDWRINMWGHSPCWPLNLHWTDQSASLQRIPNMHHLSTLTIKAKSLPTSLDVLVFCFVNGDPMCCFQLHVNINNNIIGTNISFYGIITFILFNQALLWGLALCQWAVQSFTRFQHSADCWFQEYESDRFASQGKALEYLTFWEEEEGSQLKRQVMPNRLGFSIRSFWGGTNSGWCGSHQDANQRPVGKAYLTLLNVYYLQNLQNSIWKCISFLNLGKLSKEISFFRQFRE